MKTKLPLVYITLALLLCACFFFGVRTYSLNKKLVISDEAQKELVEKLEGFERLTEIDSMLLKGEYNSVIESYSASLDSHKENKMGIPLRIALAEKLLHDKTGARSSENTMQKIADSSALQTSATTGEIRKFDSINFTLEKTKVQLARLKKQLTTKSFGEYLQFKSKKGNQMHYVGQVKNRKANGFGIALLDTGSRYEGQWKNNERNGEGTFFWPDGEYYVGTYVGDKRSGFGTYYWPNGEKYAGEWKEDKRSGSGQFYGSDGDVVADGEWNDDKLVEINKK